MIKKFDDEVACVLTNGFVVGVHFALAEHVVKSDSGCNPAMKFNFANAALF